MEFVSIYKVIYGFNEDAAAYGQLILFEASMQERLGNNPVNPKVDAMRRLAEFLKTGISEDPVKVCTDAQVAAAALSANELRYYNTQMPGVSVLECNLLKYVVDSGFTRHLCESMKDSSWQCEHCGQGGTL